jgi:hypothetical protein
MSAKSLEGRKKMDIKSREIGLTRFQDRVGKHHMSAGIALGHITHHALGECDTRVTSIFCSASIRGQCGSPDCQTAECVPVSSDHRKTSVGHQPRLQISEYALSGTHSCNPCYPGQKGRGRCTPHKEGGTGYMSKHRSSQKRRSRREA